MTRAVVLDTSFDHLPVRRGKVRDIYDLGDRLLLVATDRISAFDWVLPSGIPGKGILLTQISTFWFDYLNVPHHVLASDLSSADLPECVERETLNGRAMLVRKCDVVPVECVVRGYLAGSAWQEYQQSGAVCGLALPSGLKECDRLPEPIFTPATKAAAGEHDENISFDQMVQLVGQSRAEALRTQSLELYNRGAKYARQRGILIADTKFEFGVCGGELLLVDEVLTPDSSRFWPADQYAPGRGQPSYDKQFVRDWLTASGWDKNSPPPELPADIVTKTRQKYVEAYEHLTGKPFGM